MAYTPHGTQYVAAARRAPRPSGKQEGSAILFFITTNQYHHKINSMSSSVLEQIRFNHEQLELFEQVVVDELNEKPSGVNSY